MIWPCWPLLHPFKSWQGPNSPISCLTRPQSLAALFPSQTLHQAKGKTVKSLVNKILQMIWPCWPIFHPFKSWQGLKNPISCLTRLQSFATLFPSLALHYLKGQLFEASQLDLTDDLALLAFLTFISVLTRSKKPKFLPDKASIICHPFPFSGIALSKRTTVWSLSIRFNRWFGLVGLSYIHFSPD